MSLRDSQNDFEGRPCLVPRRLCEARSGDLAHVIGRARLVRGQPMVVEHAGGIYLLHSLCGRTLTQGYGPEFDIVAVFEEEREAD